MVWYPAATNTAGDLTLGAGSTFMQAVETKREILVWTDTALNSMRFIGPPFTFGLQQLASNITIMSPNAAVATEDVVFWMGIDNFYVYAGQTQQLPCTVKDKVFLDFNFEQADKVVSGINSEFSEVFWFYPSAAAVITTSTLYITTKKSGTSGSCPFCMDRPWCADLPDCCWILVSLQPRVRLRR